MSEISPPLDLSAITILYHPKIAESEQLARSIGRWFNGHGLETWIGRTWDEDEVRAHIPDSDILVTLGGDGSMLRAARMAAGHDTPILGVNMGRLGFLSEMSPDNWEERMPMLLDNQHWIERRTMLEAVTRRDGEIRGKHIALNDVVISRGSLARVVRLKTRIDGEKFTVYVADGIIIATPTGSTAYALAAGGPILPPELRNFLVIPIAPHLTLDRAVVLSEGAEVNVNISTDHQAMLSVDGQYEFDLQDVDEVDVHANPDPSYFVRLGKRTYFYHTLLERLEPKEVDW